jgi:CBS domain containing-hemolysin-like protein
MTVLILIVALTLLISFCGSLAEVALLSSRMSTLEVAKAAGTHARLAERLIEMKRNIAVPISAVVIGQTVAHTAGATVVGLYAAEVLGDWLVPLFTVLFAVGMVLLGEIVPKSLGVVYWRTLWPFIVWPVTVLKFVLYPVLLLTEAFAGLITRGRKAQLVTEEEILATVRLGATEGEISHDESLLVHNIISLENRQVQEIMTPRTVIFSLPAEMTVKEALKAVDQKGFTRVPIYEKDRENIIGYITIHDLFSVKTLQNPQIQLKSLVNPISFVPETSDSLALLTAFLKHRRHIAIVVDEYGGVAGVVTLEDLIETLLGKEIVDETDRVVDLQQRAREIKPQRPST